jgi:beta-glucosidase
MSYFKQKCLTALIASLSAVTLLFAQSGDFVTSGKVVIAGGQAVPMATVTYTSVGQRLSWDFSRADGTFGTYIPTPVKPVRQNERLNITEAGPLSIEVFDVKGKKVQSIVNTNIEKGIYELQPVSAQLSPSFYLVKIKTGNGVHYQKLLTVGRKNGSVLTNALSSPSSSSPFMLAKTILAVIDTIRIGKTGYTSIKIPITRYDTSIGTQTIAVDNIETKVTTMYGQMSQAEVMGQLKMPHIGSYSANVGSIFGGGGEFSGYNPTSCANECDRMQNLQQGTARKVPLMIAYDGVHGMDVMPGGTILPHNMGMGAIQDSTIFEKAMRVAALEMRATGANWTFGPCVAVIRDDRWGRSYEGFAETPELTVKYARWAILGMQTSDLSHPWSIAATTKHFAGDGGSSGGANPGQTSGTDAQASPIHLPGYTSAIAAGTACIMPSFSQWTADAGGTRMHCYTALLTNWLKNGQAHQGVAGNNFDGFVVGDWDAHNVCGSADASIACGLDVPMYSGAVGAMTYNARTQDACRRVLRVKYRMDLFNQYLAPRSVTSLVGSAAHRDAVRAAVRASLVLLKNANTALPIPTTARVAVWGQGGNDVGIQCGGWTVSWQGSTGTPTPGTTIYAGIQSIIGAANVTYSQNGTATAGTATHIIAVLSENPYAEKGAGNGISGINLTGDFATGSNQNVINNIAAVKAASPNVKIIMVLMAGRALSVAPVINNCDAFVWASLPGTEGLGIGQVMFNVTGYHFTGKLPLTWPTTVEPINVGDGLIGQYPYQAGLSPY